MTERFDPLRASTEIVDGYRRYLRSLLPAARPRPAAPRSTARSTPARMLSKGPLPGGDPGRTRPALASVS